MRGGQVVAQSGQERGSESQGLDKLAHSSRDSCARSSRPFPATTSPPAFQGSYREALSEFCFVRTISLGRLVLYAKSRPRVNYAKQYLSYFILYSASFVSFVAVLTHPFLGAQSQQTL